MSERDLADLIYLTRVQVEVDGDTFFPEIDMNDWQVLESESFPISENRKHAYTFEILERR